MTKMNKIRRSSERRGEFARAGKRADLKPAEATNKGSSLENHYQATFASSRGEGPEFIGAPVSKSPTADK